MNTSSDYRAIKRSPCKKCTNKFQKSTATPPGPTARKSGVRSRHGSTPAPGDDQKALDLSQVATLLGLSDGTVQLWAEDGQLKGSKSSEGWTFLPRDIDAFVQARCHLPGFFRIRLDDSRLGDPWFLRRKRSGHVEPAAGSNGRPLDGGHFQEPLDPLSPLT